MASGDQVMRISGDFSGYVAGAKRAEEATGKIGKQAVKMAEGFTGSLIKVELLKKAVNAVLQGMDRINEKNLAASRTHDDRMMSIGTAAGTLGVDGNILKGIIQSGMTESAATGGLEGKTVGGADRASTGNKY